MNAGLRLSAPRTTPELPHAAQPAVVTQTTPSGGDLPAIALERASIAHRSLLADRHGAPTLAAVAAKPELSAKSLRQLNKAPPAFPLWDGKAVFVDFQKVVLDVTFDVATQKATVKAKVTFVQPETGYPVSDLVPSVSGVVIDGESLEPSSYTTIGDPDGHSRFRALQKSLEPGTHELELTYELDEGLKWTDGGIYFFSEMSDLALRQFSEQYFPANFEFDQYATDMTLRIKGADHVPRVVVNGEMTTETEEGVSTYRIKTPEWYTTSSLFLEIHNPDSYATASKIFEGEDGKKIPVHAYVRDGWGSEEGQLNRALDGAIRALTELESRFGPFPHASYHVHLGGWGGMEHSGGTYTGMSALSHETCHQWLARGSTPAGGNHGWMDEALASWRDGGYRRPSGVSLGGGYPQLSGFSKYKRDTPQASYSHGARVMGELDYIFRDQGGLLPQLKEFLDVYRHQTVTTEMFVSFLDARWPAKTGFSAKEYFDNKVYSRGDVLAPKAREAHAILTSRLVGLYRAESKEQYEAALSHLEEIRAYRFQGVVSEETRGLLEALPAHLREELIDQVSDRLATLAVQD